MAPYFLQSKSINFEQTNTYKEMAKLKTPPVGVCSNCNASAVSDFYIDPKTKNWIAKGRDTGIKAEGTDGTSPRIGSNGNWFIGNSDTGVKAVGDSPRIGSNGNWWIGDQDTGVPAAGSDASIPSPETDDEIFY